MELDQFLFKKAIGLLGPFLKKKKDPGLLARQATLSQLKSRLTILARLITALPIEVAEAETVGGIDGSILFLPPAYDRFPLKEDNELFYIWRLALLCERLNRGANFDLTDELTALHTAFPSLRNFTDRVLIVELISTGNLNFIQGGFVRDPKRSAALLKEGPAQSNPEGTEISTEIEGIARENTRSHEVNKKAIEEYTLNHSFEKVETLEEFQGNWRDMDGSDDLTDHEEALREMDLRDTVRTDSPVHSVFKTEFLQNANAAESSESAGSGYFVRYPEWDFKKKRLRPDFCRVYPLSSPSKKSDFAARTLADYNSVLNRLRRGLSMINNEFEQVRRQSSGTEPDMDRIVDNFAEIRAGRTPDENVYIDNRKRRRELAVTILMDLSLSTDSFTGGQRILDVEKKAVTLFSQILEEAGDAFSIAGFYSRTRNQCQYINVKRFKDPWLTTKTNIGALAPSGYTRIGPAIRHATAEIERESSRQKWILLLSDGKPNDYDRYEGRYGMEDVRKSLQEARKKGINVYALAVETQARNYLPLMLGHGYYRILPRPEMLPEALTQFYSRLVFS